MRMILLVAMIAALAATPALAQSDAICLYADSLGNTCNPMDTTSGILSVYVLHKTAPGALGVEFSAPQPSCMLGAAYLADGAPFPVTIGNSQQGVSIGYGTCHTGTIWVLTILYYATGQTTPDCAYPVLPFLEKSAIVVADCDQQLQFAAGGTTYLNSTLPCECDGLTLPPILDVSPSHLSIGVGDSGTFGIENLGGETLGWSVSTNEPWMVLDPTSGVDDATVSVLINRNGLDEGQYEGAVTVTSNGGTAIVTVSMTVEDPQLALLPATLDFGGTETQLQFLVSNSGGFILEWSLSADQTWITADPMQGSNDTYVTVTVDRSGLAPGQYQGAVTVTSNGGIGAVNILMTVLGPPELSVSPTTLDFGNAETVMPFGITNVGTAGLNWTVSPVEPWISVEPTAGTDDGDVTVTVDRSQLAEGDHTGTVHVTSNGGNATVTVMVTQAPVLSLNPTTLDFGDTETELTFDITNSGVGTLVWSTSVDQAWISSVSPDAGVGDGTVTVTVDRDLVTPGQYPGHVFVSSNGGNGTITVYAGGIPMSGPAGAIYVGDRPDGAMNCDLLDNTEGLCSYYVVHLFTPGATGSQFKIESAHAGTQLPDSEIFPATIGNSWDGVSIGYGACPVAPIHILTLNYFCQGTTPACAEVRVVGHPTATPPGLLAVDCDQNLLWASGGVSIINGDESCFCSQVKTHEKTWGQIKELYR